MAGVASVLNVSVGTEVVRNSGPVSDANVASEEGMVGNVWGPAFIVIVGSERCIVGVGVVWEGGESSSANMDPERGKIQTQLRV